jgi:hypothetical protein
MRELSAERIKRTNMANTEATTTDKAAAAAAQGAPGAPETVTSRKGATRKKGAPTGRKAAKGKGKAAVPKKQAARREAKPVGKKASKPKTAGLPREFSKKAAVLDLLRRPKGATLAEIMDKMGWQKHTVRGFMAGAMKKAGYTVESFKPEGGERTYRINK